MVRLLRPRAVGLTIACTNLRVGSGMGPLMRAPVFSAVSTIRWHDWSSSSWSKAFNLMRMLLPAAMFLHSRCLFRVGRAFQPALPAETRARKPAPRGLLRQNLRHHAGPHRVPALADGEAQALLHRHRLD